ncbi:hypothetical protein LCGC14_2551600, partial [marine sediment metagenome]
MPFLCPVYGEYYKVAVMRKKLLLIQSVALVVCVFVGLINLNTVSGSTDPNDTGVLEPVLT